ncbi:MAG: type II toxin-antitoxin system HicA family toxin [Eubacteriaceae bacterium]
MPKIPRDITGKELIKILDKLGYKEVRRTSSHIRLSANISNKSIHHITIPDHNPIKIGTLNNILSDIADNFKIEKKTLIEKLFH